MEEKLISEFMLKYKYMFDSDEWFWKDALMKLLKDYKLELNKTPFERMTDNFNDALFGQKR